MNLTSAALVVGMIAAGHIAYMARSSGQVSTAQKLAMQAGSQFAVLNQLVERLKDREVLIQSAEATGNENLANCLREGTPTACTGGVFTVHSASVPPQPLTSQNNTDYRYNLKGGLCRQTGSPAASPPPGTPAPPATSGVGSCEIAPVVTFALNGGTIRIDVTVHTRQNTSQGAIGAQILSTNPSLQPASQSAEYRNFLRELAPAFAVADFWHNPKIPGRNAPKCYPGASRIPIGISDSFGMLCGSFTLDGATGTRCPTAGHVVKQILATGVTVCGPL